MKLSTTFETSPLACAESAGSTLTAQAKAQIGAWYRSGCNAAGAPYRSWNAATIRKHSLRPLLLALPAAVLLSGCATTRVASVPQAERDPLEGFNRTVWSVNRGIDTVVLKPVSTVYRTVIPRPARKGVTGVFQNLTEPWSFVNNMLQLRPKRAFQNLGRFVVNTTVGVGGLGDPATKFGIKPAPEDFGQTLGRWGVGGGAYMVLPLFGPSTLRDGVGLGVGFVADPAQIGLTQIGVSNGQQLGLTALEVVDGRAQMTEGGVDAFLKASLDPYAAARSAFLQRRRGEILNQADDDQDLPTKGTLDPKIPQPSSLEQGSPAAGTDGSIDSLKVGAGPVMPGETAAPLPERAKTDAGNIIALPRPPSSPDPISIAPLPGPVAPNATPPVIRKVAI